MEEDNGTEEDDGDGLSTQAKPKKRVGPKVEALPFTKYTRDCLKCGGDRTWSIDKGVRKGDKVVMEITCPGCDTHVTDTQDFNQIANRLEN